MAGNNPFRKKIVPQAVRDEIASRSQKAITWNPTRFPWIKVTSMSDGCSTRYETLSSLKGDLYDTGFDKPYPVITGVDVKKQGELGTTRKATVKITAFRDEQLAELQKCHFLPGMSIRVEWGWSIGSTGQQVGNIGSSRVLSDTVANGLMKKAAAGNPNYDGLQGIVGNFTYNLTSNNFWDCTIEIIAAAETFGGTKANDYSCPDCVGKQKEPESGKEKVENRSRLYAFFFALFNDYDSGVRIYKNAINTIASIDGKTADFYQYNFNAAGRDENGGEDVGWLESITPDWLNQPDTTEPFITWSTFEAAINHCCAQTSGGPKEFLYGRLTSKNIPLAYNAFATSADPRVCLLPGTISAGSVGEAYSIATRKKGGNPSTCVGNDESGRKSIILDKILLNTVMLMVELKNVEKQGDGTLKTYIMNVLNRVNDACGNLWDFEVVSTSEDVDNNDKYPTLTIVDTKKSGPAEGDTYELPARALTSVLRDLKLDMKMTDAMKTQALYSNSSRQPASKTAAGGSCGANGLEGFRNGTIKNLALAPKVDPPKCDECKAVNKGEKPPELLILVAEVKEDVSDTTVSAVKSKLIATYAESVNKGDNSHCAGMIIPFEFSFTLDGVGGFVFGQGISCDRIPEPVRSRYYFQVTSVEHSITVNDWTTTVNTVPRYKPR